MKSKIVIFMLSIFAATAMVFGQNRPWILGNTYIPDMSNFNLPNNLPTPNGPSGLDYAGQQAQYAANAWHHPQTGALLFFVVDGVVYDGEGYYLGSLDEFNTPVNNDKMRGISEISIVPDPGDCKRFYVIGGKRNATDSNPIMPPGAVGVPANELNSELFYGVVNLALPRENFNTNRTGSLELLDNNINSGYILSLKTLIPTNQKYNNVSNWSGLDFIAVSPKNNNQYFLFYQDKFGLIYTFRINASGIQYINNSVVDTRTGLAPNFSNQNQYLEHVSRAELEVITLTNGNFRVVGTSYNPILNSVNNSIQSAQKVYRLDFSPLGAPLISSFTQYHHHSNNSLGQTLIRSIEISPNKNFVYFTSINNNIFERSIYCLDMQTFDLVPLPGISDASTLPFKHSVIERANNGTAEGMLLIAKEDGAYRILNPNTPSTASLSATPVIPVNLQKSRMNYPNNPWWDDRVGLYLLPDQMDFDPNCQVGCYNFACGDGSADEACCLFYSSISPNSNIVVFNDIVVTSSTTWLPGSQINGVTIPANGQFRVTGNVTIEPGVTLTMQNLYIEFSPTSKVVVSRGVSATSTGARLSVRNSTLTAAQTCGNCYMWQGIEAHGYNTSPQSAVGQSRVQIIMNSVIEYAHNGVFFGNLNSWNAAMAGGTSFLQLFQNLQNAISHTGGRLTAHSSTFLNNKHDATFLPYSNHQNNSVINFCNLVTNENLPAGAGNGINTPIHVQIWGNRGLEFRASRFSNTTPNLNDGTFRGIGISAASSNFVVTSSPTSSSEFNALNIGVLAQSGNPLNFSVTDSKFTDNYIGIFARSEVNSVIVNNEFYVFNPGDNSGIETYGVYLEGCNRYRVEENYLTTGSSNVKNGLVYGVVADNSGPFANVIEKNTFEKLNSGGVTRKLNADLSQKRRGLQWLCNDFINDDIHDLWVQQGGSIALTQGLLFTTNVFPGTIVNFDFPTGNIFHSANNPQWHIKLEDDVPNILYHHHPNGTPTLYSTNKVALNQSNAFQNSFSDRYCGRKIDVPSFNSNDLITQREALFAEKKMIDDLLDFGNTDSLIMELFSQTLTDEQKRDLLKQESITISDDVLIEYILSNPSHQNLFQVLVYNSPLTDKVIYHMMEKSSLPSGMKQQVLLVQDGFSIFEANRQMAQEYELNIKYLESLLVGQYLSDTTISNAMDKIVDLYELSPENDYENLEMLFYAYAAKGDVNKADSINLILKNLVNDDNYSLINDLVVASINSDYFSLLITDSALIGKLEMLAELSDFRSSYKARALLSGYLGFIFEPGSGSAMGSKNMIYPKYTYDGSVLETVSIFPNPAQDHFFIVFDENADVSKNRQVKVYNLSGVLQLTREMKANDYVLEIKTENMAKGMYLVTISENGREISTHKVAVR